MHRTVVFLLVMGVGSGPVLASLCPPDWQRYGESCYFLITQKISWYDANSTCQEMNAEMAIPDTQLEHDFLWELFLLSFEEMPDVSLWIGCNDIEEEGRWEGCPLKAGNQGLFENWKTGQPDSVSGADCGVLGVRHSGLWDDQLCTLRRYAVCEFRIPVSNSPATFCLTTEADGTFSSKCLVRHTLKELPAKGIVSCGKACRSESRCRSFNLLKRGHRKAECQLNNATRLEAGEADMDEIEKCFFFDL